MPIVQSSGTSKSRLIDFHSTVITRICYTLQWDGHGGYLPGDPEITQFLAGSPSTLQVQPSGMIMQNSLLCLLQRSTKASFVQLE